MLLFILSLSFSGPESTSSPTRYLSLVDPISPISGATTQALTLFVFPLACHLHLCVDVQIKIGTINGVVCTSSSHRDKSSSPTDANDPTIWMLWPFASARHRFLLSAAGGDTAISSGTGRPKPPRPPLSSGLLACGCCH